MRELRHLELFAGIGGFRKAIDTFGRDHGFRTQCVGFSEIDPWALRTYRSNFDTEGELELGDLAEFTSKRAFSRSVPSFDLLTAGFPCQPFSMMGNKTGFRDERGNVFYKIIELIKALRSRKPKYLLFENVKNLLSHDNGRTLSTILALLDEIGYRTHTCILNSNDFGLAQTRNRIFIFGLQKCSKLSIEFSKDLVKKSFDAVSNSTSLLKQDNVLDVLHKRVPENFYLSEKIKPTILSDGTGGFKSKSEINRLVARPLTATMVKLHRACQDNYYSDGFIRSRNPIRYLRKEFTKAELCNQRIRKLTPDEALSLQGFDMDFFVNARNAGVSSHQLYKQAGNAVSVNTVYALLNYLFKELSLPLE